MQKWYILPCNLFHVLTLARHDTRHSWYYVLKPTERDIRTAFAEFAALTRVPANIADVSKLLEPLTSFGYLNGTVGDIDFEIQERSFER